jgi:hypothetical protein
MKRALSEMAQGPELGRHENEQDEKRKLTCSSCHSTLSGTGISCFRNELFCFLCSRQFKKCVVCNLNAMKLQSHEEFMQSLWRESRRSHFTRIDDFMRKLRARKKTSPSSQSAGSQIHSEFLLATRLAWVL